MFKYLFKSFLKINKLGKIVKTIFCFPLLKHMSKKI